MSKFLKSIKNLNKDKKVAAIIVIVLFVVFIAILTFQKSYALGDIASGTSGDCGWNIDENGKLTIGPTSSTTGERSDYKYVDVRVPPLGSTDDSYKKDSYTLTGTPSANTTISVEVSDTTKTFTGGTTSSQNVEGRNGTVKITYDGDKTFSFLLTSGTTFEARTFFSYTVNSSTTSCVLNDYYDGLTPSEPWYQYRTDITSVVIEKGVSTSIKAAGLFSGLNNATSIDLKELKTTGTTNMSSMFSACKKLTSLNLTSTNFNTSSVTNISRMFSGCTSLKMLDLSKFNATNIKGTASDYAFNDLGKDNKNGCKITLNSTFNSLFSFPSKFYAKETNNTLGDKLFSSSNEVPSLFEEERKSGTYSEQQISEPHSWSVDEPDDRNGSWTLTDITENTSFNVVVDSNTYNFVQGTEKTITGDSFSITYDGDKRLDFTFISKKTYNLTFNYTKSVYTGSVTKGVITWVPAYSVTYDKNGGDSLTGTKNPQIYETGTEVDTRGYSATKSNHTLFSWNTVAENPGTKTETKTLELNDSSWKSFYLTNGSNSGSTIDVTINGTTSQIVATYLNQTTIGNVRVSYQGRSKIDFKLTSGEAENYDISIKYNYGLPFEINKQSNISYGDNYSTTNLNSGNITLYAQYIQNPTPSISGGTTKIYDSGDNTTLTCTENTEYPDYYDKHFTKKYSFGYSESESGTVGNWSEYSNENTISINKKEYIGQRYYKCRVAVLFDNNTIVETPSENKTEMKITNAQLTFNANGGTITGDENVYTRTGENRVYATLTGTSNTTTIPTASKSSESFIGWFNAPTGGQKVLNKEEQQYQDIQHHLKHGL